MKMYIKLKTYLLITLSILAISVFTGCAQSYQEKRGINLLPQNRPSQSSPNTGMGFTF